jgi:LacI family transcriptional regulator
VVARLGRARPRPTALVSADARTTMSLLPALAGCTWAVIGFGDFPMAHMLSPALTVIDQDPAALGRLAAERAVARLASPERRFRRHTVVPVRLVERRSCWSPAESAELFPSSCPRSETSASQLEAVIDEPHLPPRPLPEEPPS